MSCHDLSEIIICTIIRDEPEYIRSLEGPGRESVAKGRSVLLLGPRQAGKTTLVKWCLAGVKGVGEYPFQDPSVRIEIERDPGALIRQISAKPGRPFVFLDEDQKVPEIFDSVQHLIDERKASFIITDSSARKLCRKVVNLLSGRVRTSRLDPLQWAEFGWRKERNEALIALPSYNVIKGFS